MTPSPKPPKPFTVAEVADRLGVSPRTIYYECADGRLGHIKVRGQIRVPNADYEEYRRLNRRGPNVDGV
jgi:excisionase family DNA binding protein